MAFIIGTYDIDAKSCQFSSYRTAMDAEMYFGGVYTGSVASVLVSEIPETDRSVLSQALDRSDRCLSSPYHTAMDVG